jgi:uncharacterized protein YqeY
MSLESTINEDLKTAMKAKDQAYPAGYPGYKSAILLFNTSGAAEEMTAEKENRIVAKAGQANARIR